MTISIGSDHAGVVLKQKIVDHLQQKGLAVLDFGPVSTDSVDYPDYAKKVCHAMVEKEADYGILICGSGIGMSIAANKIDGIRCALIYSEETARLCKEHNNANVIAIGERLTNHDLALKMVDIYLDTKFDDRHKGRVCKISELEGDDCECCDS